MKSSKFLILLVIVSTSLHAQDFKLINTIPFLQASLTTDNLGNSYVIAENQLFQFDQYGKPKANFSDRNAGHLFAVDVSNPLRIVLFYPDFAQLKILDSKLAVQSTIELRNIGFLQPVAACQSSKDGYWIYDQQDAQLKKLNLTLQIQQESGNLNQLVGYSLAPDYILENDNFIYVNNPATGILVFDQFGVFLKTLPYKGLKSFQAIENTLLFVQNNKFWKYNLKTLELSEILTPPHDLLLNARIEQFSSPNPFSGGQELYLLTIASLSFYSY